MVATWNFFPDFKVFWSDFKNYKTKMYFRPFWATRFLDHTTPLWPPSTPHNALGSLHICLWYIFEPPFIISHFSSLHLTNFLYLNQPTPNQSYTITQSGGARHNAGKHSCLKRCGHRTCNSSSVWKAWVKLWLDHDEVIKILNLNTSIRYTTGFWQLIKWAWIQYLAVLVIFLFVFDRIKTFIYQNQLVTTVVQRPLEIKPKF